MRAFPGVALGLFLGACATLGGVGEFEDGCFPYESPGEEGITWTSSICGDEFTTSSPNLTLVMHKRHPIPRV